MPTFNGRRSAFVYHTFLEYSYPFVPLERNSSQATCSGSIVASLFAPGRGQEWTHVVSSSSTSGCALLDPCFTLRDSASLVHQPAEPPRNRVRLPANKHVLTGAKLVDSSRHCSVTHITAEARSVKKNIRILLIFPFTIVSLIHDTITVALYEHQQNLTHSLISLICLWQKVPVVCRTVTCSSLLALVRRPPSVSDLI